METVSKLDVFMNGEKVGTIAPYKKYLTAFEYAPEWIQNGYSISPFSLTLRAGVQIAKPDPFNGLFGIFFDSLPDGWGRLLVDRMLRKSGERPEELSALARLSIVGTSGMGAMEYKPVYPWKTTATHHDLDRLASECKKILRSEESEDLDTLYALGGSSGGARPKVFLQVDGDDWIVKFPSSYDPTDIGAMEYEYTLCAAECGIDVPEVRLFPSKTCSGYFGCKRFDRIKTTNGVRKVHMASASALLEVSHRIPALDYSSLMALSWQLTKRASEMEKLFRLMCFNVFAHNRDDHSNNFSFLCEGGVWRLAPAYDLTYSNSLGGEHATTINGEGRSPSMDDILNIAKKASISAHTAKKIAESVQTTVEERLGKYLVRR